MSQCPTATPSAYHIARLDYYINTRAPTSKFRQPPAASRDEQIGPVYLHLKLSKKDNGRATISHQRATHWSNAQRGWQSKDI